VGLLIGLSFLRLGGWADAAILDVRADVVSLPSCSPACPPAFLAGSRFSPLAGWSSLLLFMPIVK